MTTTSYSKFGGFFDKVIRDYHGDEYGNKKHITDWDVEGSDYDVKQLGLGELSMRAIYQTPISSLKRNTNSLLIRT
eukprot:CCRYP_016554-RA/>CCRYP_016554-RA protein AED:0.48 eAED:0.63 QI:0/0/0/1/0/0/2/0/75